MPTLKALFDAAPTSALACVDVNNVVDLFVNVTNERHLVNATGTAENAVCSVPNGFLSIFF